MADRTVHLGEVAVDSGTLMITDPCYAGLATGNWMDEVRDISTSPTMSVPFREGVAFMSGLGDGIYDVEAVMGDVHGWGDRIKQVIITLIEDDEDEWDEDE